MKVPSGIYREVMKDDGITEVVMIIMDPGVYTSFHDHADCYGQVSILSGAALEYKYDRDTYMYLGSTIHPEGDKFSETPQYIHCVRNLSNSWKLVMMNIYTPPLRDRMREYPAKLFSTIER